MLKKRKNFPGAVTTLRIIISGLTCTFLAACPGPMSASIIYNNTGAPITVAYSMRPLVRPLDGMVECPLHYDESKLPRVRAGKPKGNIYAGDAWEYVPGYQSVQEGCDVSFELSPGFSALLYSNGACSDFKKYVNGAEFESTLERLRIQTQDGVVEFTNWEISKQFVRVSDDVCLLDLG